MKPRKQSQSLPLRIAVDMPWDATACMGTGAYSETMVRALAQAAPHSMLLLIVPLGTPHRIQLPNVTYVSLPATEGLTEGTRQIALPAFLREADVDCLFAPAGLVPATKVCPMVATVHDLTFETLPEYYSSGLVEYLSRWMPVTLAGADRIVAISDTVKQDLVGRKRVDPLKVDVVEQPIRETFLNRLSETETKAELRALNIHRPFFFHVSNLAPHKNMELGIRIFSEFLRRNPQAPHELLFAGGGLAPAAPPDLIALARTLGIGDRVRYVGKVSDSRLKALYQSCEVFLFPSRAEGWGLPVVEARALGARVLASPHVPSAVPEERIPLDPQKWVEELEGSVRKPVGNTGPRTVEAGQKLLEAIVRAISRSSEKRVPPTEKRGGSGIAIRADWHSPSGLGQAARGVFQALACAGLNPRAAAAPKDAIQDKRLWREEVTLRRDPAELWIHHTPPEQMDLSLAGKHAGYVFWETDRLPEVWPETLSQLNEIWAPSRFVADTLKASGVRAPIHPIPLPIDTGLFAPGPRRAPAIDLPPGFDPSWTVFLYVGTWDPRKRPDILVRAFCRGFSEKDQALLVIKSYVTGDAARDRKILGQWISGAHAGDAHVRCLPEILSPQAMADLFRFSTTFVTASRGEGYCLPAVQAMSTGKPVVAPGWSSFQDLPIMKVDHELEPVPREAGLPGFSTNQRWAVVNEDDLAAKLRWVHENRDAVRLLGKKSRDWVLENAAMNVVGAQLKRRVEALCKRVVGSRLVEVSR